MPLTSPLYGAVLRTSYCNYHQGLAHIDVSYGDFWACQLQ